MRWSFWAVVGFWGLATLMLLLSLAFALDLQTHVIDLQFGSRLHHWLPLATVVITITAFVLAYAWRRRMAKRWGSARQLENMTATLSYVARAWRGGLWITGLTLIAIAIARPQRPGEEVVDIGGIDLVITLDFSKSMLAEDVAPSRLALMLDRADDIVERLEKNSTVGRLGSVVFAQGAATFPLTRDVRSTQSFYRGFATCGTQAGDAPAGWCAPTLLPPGSDLGDGLRSSACLLRPDVTAFDCGEFGKVSTHLEQEEFDEPSLRRNAQVAQAVVVITDGEDHPGNAAAMLDQLVKQGIKVYFVGVGVGGVDSDGKPNRVTIPEFDGDGRRTGVKRDRDGNDVLTRLEQDDLRQFAAIAGGDGHYFELAESQAGLPKLEDALKRLKNNDLRQRARFAWVDSYEWALFAGFMLLVIEACISERRRRLLYPERQVYAES